MKQFRPITAFLLAAQLTLASVAPASASDRYRNHSHSFGLVESLAAGVFVAAATILFLPFADTSGTLPPRAQAYPANYYPAPVYYTAPQPVYAPAPAYGYAH